MIEQLKQYLLAYKKKTIELRTVQEEFPSVEYRELAPILLQFMKDGVLVGGKELNHRDPRLPKKFRIVLTKFQEDFFERLRNSQLKRHPLISLDAYYKLSKGTFEADLPWIEQVDAYLASRNHADDLERRIPLPEASYHMVGNEKWLEEEGGDKLLRRLGLTYEQLGLYAAPEPLMLAVNPALLNKDTFQHLIVENKTPFHALLHRFQNQNTYSTLIFGRGKMILSSMQRFYQQTGLVPAATHHFHYFGDLDYEGIGIWHALAKLWPVVPAVDFYQQLLHKTPGPGKTNHRPLHEELEAFCAYFPDQSARQIRSMLAEGHYLPQEAVTSREWEAYGRNRDE